MNFDLSEEQQLLKDSLARFLGDRYGFEARRGYRDELIGFDARIWQGYADLGLLALPFAEADGGLGGGPVDMMVVMEELGRVLALEPYLSTAVIGAALVRHVNVPEERTRITNAVGSGRLSLAFAHDEASLMAGEDIETRARTEAGGWRLDGSKTLVVNGDGVDRLIVSAKLDGGETALFLIDPQTAGVHLRGYPTQDGRRAAEVGLEDVSAEMRLSIDDADAAIAAAHADAIAALCAEAVGVMDEALRATVDYLKTRKQFGVEIGTFQGLQHQAADMAVEVEQARSMALYATMMCRYTDPDARDRAMSAAKLQICRSARMVGQTAVQLHGGVGMTMELAIGHYFKRLTMIESAFGDADTHLDRLSMAGGLAA